MNFDKNKFKKLAETFSTGEPRVSLYVKTHRAGDPGDRIRLKNAITEAVDQLEAGKLFANPVYNKNEAMKFMAPAYDLLDNDEFWSDQSDGLAIFISEGTFEYFTVPVDFENFVYVGHEFYLRHLMPLITGENRFFLLALSQGAVRFFEGHKHHITPVIIGDLVPENLEAATFAYEKEGINAHSAGGRLITHGHADTEAQKDIDIEKYFRQVDDGLMEMLHDENAPLIIAAVDYLVPIYKNISKYSNIVDFHVSGNPDNEGPAMLHERAWSMMSDIFRKEKEEKKANFAAHLSNEKGTNELHETVRAAASGKVDTLFIDKNAPVTWGFHKELTDYEVKTHEAQNAYNSCLLNYAALQTWKNGGTVYNVSKEDLPQEDSSVNTIFRY